MVESEANIKKGVPNLEIPEESSSHFFNGFLLDTVRTCPPEMVVDVFEKFCKTIQLEYWEQYKKVGTPRNIANNHGSMLIADFAYDLDPTEEDTPIDSHLKRMTIFHLIEARERIFKNTRNKKRPADIFADSVISEITRVDENKDKEVIILPPPKSSNPKRSSVKIA